MSEEGIQYLGEGVRVFEKKSSNPDDCFKFLVDSVFRYTDDPEDRLYLGLGTDTSAMEYPADIEDVVTDPSTGTITFSVYDGDYTIRALQPDDGKWISRLKISLPTKALEYMTSEKEDDSVNPNVEEQLIAYSEGDNSGPIFAVQYINGFGSFVRISGKWMLLSPNDESFDGMHVYDIDPDKSPEFMSAFDKGNLTVEDAQEFMLTEEESQ